MGGVGLRLRDENCERLKYCRLFKNHQRLKRGCKTVPVLDFLLLRVVPLGNIWKRWSLPYAVSGIHLHLPLRSYKRGGIPQKRSVPIAVKDGFDSSTGSVRLRPVPGLASRSDGYEVA